MTKNNKSPCSITSPLALSKCDGLNSPPAQNQIILPLSSRELMYNDIQEQVLEQQEEEEDEEWGSTNLSSRISEKIHGTSDIDQEIEDTRIYPVEVELGGRI